MTETLTARLYECMLIIYAAALVLYFIDYLYKNVRARRIAFWFVCIVWGIQTVLFAFFIVEAQRFPILSLGEGIYFYTWLLISLSIGLHCIARVDMPVVFINALAFVFMTIYMFVPESEGDLFFVNSIVVSELLIIHIAIAMISYAAFTVAFVFAMMHLIVYRFLKAKKFSATWNRLPSLTQTTTWMSKSSLVGTPLLLISLILGTEWAILTVDSVEFFDLKIIGSFFIACIYIVLLVLHRSGKLLGTTYAWCHVYTYLLVVLNFFLGNTLSNFHGWY